MFKTSLIYFLIRGANGVVALATIAILTRLFEPSEYGAYALGVAGIALFSSVFFNWITVSVARFYAMHVEAPAILLAESYRRFLQVAGLAILLTACFSIWSPIESVSPLFAVAVGVGSIAMGWHILELQISNAQSMPSRYGLLTLSRSVFVLVFVIVAYYAGFGSLGAVIGVGLASAASAGAFWRRRQFQLSATNNELRSRLVKYGLPLTFTYLGGMILSVSDRFMIAAWLGAAAAAGYSAAYDIALLTIGTAINVFFLAGYPRVTLAWEEGGAAGARVAMLPLARAVMIGVPLISGIFIGMASDIAWVFLGESIRADAERIIPWVAVAMAIMCLKSYILDIAFQLKKETHMQLRITLLMAAVNVGLNFMLISSYGVLGAAISTVVAFSLGAVLSWSCGRALEIYPATMRDFATMIVAFLAVVLAIQLLPSGDHSLLLMAARLAIGMAGFTIVVMIGDLMGCRRFVVRVLRTKLSGSIS